MTSPRASVGPGATEVRVGRVPRAPGSRLARLARAVDLDGLPSALCAWWRRHTEPPAPPVHPIIAGRLVVDLTGTR